MSFLLDTHALLWSLDEPERFSVRTRDLLSASGNDVFVSVVALWEIAIKHRLGKLGTDVGQIVALLAPPSKLHLLGIALRHLVELQRLPVVAGHRDPFDHLLIAQAVAEGMTFVSADQHVPRYDVTTIAP